ncbi:MAG TPA: YtxH domain-containing protein [Terriglobales bacterium]|jgi:gas vesicle protein|nr:YtxH domain-containing protein [Terriglobales bacterium]
MANNDGSSILWFLAGVGIGTAVGVLYAPRSGSETREVLRTKADEGRDFVRARAQEAREHANEWVDKGREAVTQQKEQVRAAYEAGKSAYQEVTTKAPEAAAQNG